MHVSTSKLHTVSCVEIPQTPAYKPFRLLAPLVTPVYEKRIVINTAVHEAHFVTIF